MQDSKEPFRVLKLAILAVGGQGGGVLANWIVDLLQAKGWRAQLTSVPGVAQRTGATIYYVEMSPPCEQQPIFALIPAPGDVDIVLAAELMEAGRAIQRGLVTEDRTTLIASTHRMYAVSEKTAPGDGVYAPQQVLDACEEAAQRFICADLDRLATENGSVISASLFGALCASEVLPFERADFEATIRGGGRGIEASLGAFSAAFDAISNPASAAVDSSEAAGPASAPPAVTGPSEMLSAYRGLETEAAEFPDACQEMLRAGLRKVCDYQDIEYGKEYLARVREFHGLDHQHGGAAEGWALVTEAARQIANAMTYDDVIRVADLKTRKSRFDRVASEAGATDDEVLQITEYFHPRLEEVLATLPTRLSQYLEGSGFWRPLIAEWFSRGRRIRSDSLRGFLSLYFVSGLRRYRRKLRRHADEMAHMETWISRVRATAGEDYRLAVAMLNARKLIKGYSDTHARGTSKFDRVMTGSRLLAGKPEAGRRLREMIEAARDDEHGKKLDEQLAVLRAPDSARTPAAA